MRQVCEGDEVVVDVHNELNNGEGTSIHWHGVLQHGSQHMDGVAMVTQCPIPAKTSFQYRCVMGISINDDLYIISRVVMYVDIFKHDK